MEGGERSLLMEDGRRSGVERVLTLNSPLVSHSFRENYNRFHRGGGKKIRRGSISTLVASGSEVELLDAAVA